MRATSRYRPLVAGLLLAAAVAVPPAVGWHARPAAHAAVAAAGVVLQVRSVVPNAPSSLVTLDPDTGEVLHHRWLEHTVNAIGYDAAQGLLYGVATRWRLAPLSGGGHLVSVSPAGDVIDHGPVLGGSAATAYAGAVAGASCCCAPATGCSGWTCGPHRRRSGTSCGRCGCRRRWTWGTGTTTRSGRCSSASTARVAPCAWSRSIPVAGRCPRGR
ncbi:hypothetical protein ACFQY4_42300 [Catellatospora bangladeshensis]|uniref:hypothetical protein n=1 Tax=Catellatospora bangladeshensis TaxID=310355 RepID=UPI003617AE14